MMSEGLKYLTENNLLHLIKKPMEKKPRIPKNPDAIFAAALILSLGHRVDLRNKLDDSIKLEVEGLKQQAQQAEKIANGKQ